MKPLASLGRHPQGSCGRKSLFAGFRPVGCSKARFEELMLKKTCKGRKNNNKLNFFVADNSPFGTPFFTPKIPPKMFMWVPFSRSFPGNEAHKLFLGAHNWGFGVGSKKFMLKKFLCFLRPLIQRNLGSESELLAGEGT